jgi:5-methyltetrahydrofolate--homocysteine methyltransferase
MDILSTQFLIGDGAMGTLLQGKGLPAGISPEIWMLSEPEKILEIMTDYVQAGARIIESNTLGANRLKLAECDRSGDVNIINTTAIKLARQAAGPDCLVAGVIGPSGQFPAPIGSISFEDLMEVFAQQAQSLSLAGADLILIQTFPDLGEARAAYLGARKVTTLPIAVSMTYGANLRTLTGTGPDTAATVFTALGADILGVNCSSGPAEMLEVVRQYRACSNLPLLAEPNAGLPVLEGNRSVFPMSPEDFAMYAPLFLESGVRWLGGCCGTTPAHIREMAKAASSWDGREIPAIHTRTASLTSRSRTLYLGAGFPPRLIGERLNPTARKVISDAYISGDISVLAREGASQIQAGADLLDINAGMAGTDEAANLTRAVLLPQQSLDCPLVIDTVDRQALELALMHYQGKALINSVNGEESSLSAVLPLAKQYGAAVIGMTLDEKGVPGKAEDRLRIAGRILDRALDAGIPKEDVYIDCLVMAAATGPEYAAETIRALMLVKEKLGLVTVLGVSNISHGMPNRSWLNQAFLAQVLAAGADLVFVNPMDPGIRITMAASAFLAGRDLHGARYIEFAKKEAATLSGQKASPLEAEAGFTHTADRTHAVDRAAATNPAAAADFSAATADLAAAADFSAAATANHATNLAVAEEETPVEMPVEALRQAILINDQQQIRKLLDPLIQVKSFTDLVDLSIIPTLHMAGDSYAEGETFLPQLLLSADGAAFTFDYLKAAMPSSVSRALETVVLGTVAGDVHDIGKNIVKALLASYGYAIVDLGKNVPAAEFIHAVKEHHARVLGLSALMTTTMTEMEPVIRRIREEGLDTIILVGGAVLTKEYAESIHADAYVRDAAEAHSVIRRLLDR